MTGSFVVKFKKSIQKLSNNQKIVFYEDVNFLCKKWWLADIAGEIPNTLYLHWTHNLRFGRLVLWKSKRFKNGQKTVKDLKKKTVRKVFGSRS